MIERSGERGSGISMLAVRHDDDDDDSLPNKPALKANIALLLFNNLFPSNHIILH